MRSPAPNLPTNIQSHPLPTKTANPKMSPSIPWAVGYTCVEVVLAIGWTFGAFPLALKVFVLAVNCVAFVLYGIDKRRAIKDAWRIPEWKLLAIAVFGGAIGADIARRLFRHKTRKLWFTVCIFAGLAIHLAMMAAATSIDMPSIAALTAAHH